jgi:hypothetical protein
LYQVIFYQITSLVIAATAIDIVTTTTIIARLAIEEYELSLRQKS